MTCPSWNPLHSIYQRKVLTQFPHMPVPQAYPILLKAKVLLSEEQFYVAYLS